MNLFQGTFESFQPNCLWCSDRVGMLSGDYSLYKVLFVCIPVDFFLKISLQCLSGRVRSDLKYLWEENKILNFIVKSTAAQLELLLWNNLWMVNAFLK